MGESVGAFWAFWAFCRGCLSCESCSFRACGDRRSGDVTRRPGLGWAGLAAFRLFSGWLQQRSYINFYSSSSDV